MLEYLFGSCPSEASSSWLLVFWCYWICHFMYLKSWVSQYLPSWKTMSGVVQNSSNLCPLRYALGHICLLVLLGVDMAYFSLCWLCFEEGLLKKKKSKYLEYSHILSNIMRADNCLHTSVWFCWGYRTNAVLYPTRPWPSLWVWVIGLYLCLYL